MNVDKSLEAQWNARLPIQNYDRLMLSKRTFPLEYLRHVGMLYP